MVKFKTFSPLFIGVFLLSGCGGGDGGGDANVIADPPPVPANFETTEYNAQYGLGKINASEIYAESYSGSGVIVGVIDTSVDMYLTRVIVIVARQSYKPHQNLGVEILGRS